MFLSVKRCIFFIFHSEYLQCACNDRYFSLLQGISDFLFFYLTLENFWNCLDLMRKNVKSFRNPKWYDRQHLDSWTCQIRVRLQLDKKESYKILSISISYMRARIEVTWVMEYIFCWRIIYGFFFKETNETSMYYSEVFFCKCSVNFDIFTSFVISLRTLMIRKLKVPSDCLFLIPFIYWTWKNRSVLNCKDCIPF